MDVAVIGCGRWGKNVIETLINLESSEDFRLREIVHSGDPGRASEIRERFRFDAHSDTGEALERNDAVCVVTPDDTHPELVRAGLETGLDVYVEKPLSYDLGEARDLYELADANNVLLMPGHLMLFHPLLLTLRDQPEFRLDDLDEIVVTRLSNLRDSGERRLLHSSLIHDVVVLDDLFEDPPETTSVRDVAGSYPPGRALIATLDYRGVPVRVRARTDWPFPERSMTFRQDNLYFRFDGLSDELSVIKGDAKPREIRSVAFEEQPLTDELRNFVRAGGGTETCGVTKQHVLRTMKTLDVLQQQAMKLSD